MTLIARIFLSDWMIVNQKMSKMAPPPDADAMDFLIPNSEFLIPNSDGGMPCYPELLSIYDQKIRNGGEYASHAGV